MKRFTVITTILAFITLSTSLSFGQDLKLKYQKSKDKEVKVKDKKKDKDKTSRIDYILKEGNEIHDVKCKKVWLQLNTTINQSVSEYQKSPVRKFKVATESDLTCLTGEIAVKDLNQFARLIGITKSKKVKGKMMAGSYGYYLGTDGNVYGAEFLIAPSTSINLKHQTIKTNVNSKKSTHGVFVVRNMTTTEYKAGMLKIKGEEKVDEVEKKEIKVDLSPYKHINLMYNQGAMVYDVKCKKVWYKLTNTINRSIAQVEAKPILNFKVATEKDINCLIEGINTANSGKLVSIFGSTQDEYWRNMPYQQSFGYYYSNDKKQVYTGQFARTQDPGIHLSTNLNVNRNTNDKLYGVFLVRNMTDDEFEKSLKALNIPFTYVSQQTNEINSDASFKLSGAAHQVGSEYILTNNKTNQKGWMWSNDKIELNQSFDLTFKVNCGFSDDGGEGMVFMLSAFQRVSNYAGSSLAYSGITPSVGVEIDTKYDPKKADHRTDHMAILKNGNTEHNNAFNLAGPIQASASSSNIEDGQWHQFRVVWNAKTKQLDVYFDYNLRLSTTIDLKKDLNNQFTYFGFASATGDKFAEHKVMVVSTKF